jgi:hypothetical protein
MFVGYCVFVEYVRVYNDGRFACLNLIPLCTQYNGVTDVVRGPIRFSLKMDITVANTR